MDIQVNNITEKLKKLGCPNEVFCAVSSISTARWSRAQRGLVTIPGDEVLRLSKIVLALEAIRDAAQPFRIDFRDIESLQKIFTDRVEGLRWLPVPAPEEQEQA